MSSHDIRDMTSRHDFIIIKFDIWLLLYVAVSELERWFHFCFARYSGQEKHSNYRRLRDLHACLQAWPWNWRSRHGLRDLCSFGLYVSNRDDFFCFVRFLDLGIHCNKPIAICVSLKYDFATQCHVMVSVTFVISACMCPTVMTFFGFVRFSGHEIYFNYFLTSTCDLETLCHIIVYVISTYLNPTSFSSYESTFCNVM